MYTGINKGDNIRIKGNFNCRGAFGGLVDKRWRKHCWGEYVSEDGNRKYYNTIQ